MEVFVVLSWLSVQILRKTIKPENSLSLGPGLN